MNTLTHLPPYVVLGKGRLGAVGQLFDGDTKFLQGLASVLGSCLQLTAVHCSQVLVTIVILNTARTSVHQSFMSLFCRHQFLYCHQLPAPLGPRLLLAVFRTHVEWFLAQSVTLPGGPSLCQLSPHGVVGSVDQETFVTPAVFLPP